MLVAEACSDAKRIIEVARRCRDAGIAVIREGARLGDIDAAIEEQTRTEGVGVITDIGRNKCGEPHVPHTGKHGTGSRLKASMALTVKPMTNLGSLIMGEPSQPQTAAFRYSGSTPLSPRTTGTR